MKYGQYLFILCGISLCAAGMPNAAQAAASCATEASYANVASTSTVAGLTDDPPRDASTICNTLGNTFLIVTKNSTDYSGAGSASWQNASNLTSPAQIAGSVLRCFDCKFDNCNPPGGGTPTSWTCTQGKIGCSAGYKLNGTTCVACPTGYTGTGLIDASGNCASCASGYTMEGTTCNIICSAGMKRTGQATCAVCDAGTYKNAANTATSCTPCPAFDSSTGNTGTPASVAATTSGTTAADHDSVQKCFISSSEKITDSTGVWRCKTNFNFKQ